MDRLAEQLEALKRLDASVPGEVAQLRKALARRSGLVVAVAAERLAEAEVDVDEELAAAFHTLCERPIKRDPGCRGKVAVLEALERRGSHDIDVYLVAARLRQLEPAWGAPDDTASGVRILGLAGLLRLRAVEVRTVLGEHVVDPVPRVREAAADVIAALGDTTGVAALRLMMDATAEPSVHEAALRAWLELDAEGALAHLAGGLTQGGAAMETAAIVLGESRREDALPLLLGALRTAPTRKERRLLCVCVATLRLPAARDALLERLDGRDGELIVEALAPYRFEQGLMGRALDAAPRELHPSIRRVLDPEA